MPRTVVPSIRNQFPSTVLEGNNELFLVFVEEYYRWLEEEGNAYGILNGMDALAETETAVESFFEEMRQEFLPYIPANVLNNKANLVRNIRDLYRAKGTPKAIRHLFRILFDQEIEIITDVVSNPSRYIRVMTNQSSFSTLMTGRTLINSAANVEYSTGSGVYLLNETVTQTVGPTTVTGLITYINGGTHLTVADLDGPLTAGYDLVGSTSGATYNVDTYQDYSFEAQIRNITSLGVSNPDPVYDVELINVRFIDVSLPTETDILIGSKSDTTITDVGTITLHTLGVVDSITLGDSGTGYVIGSTIPFSDTGSGFDSIITVTDATKNRIQLPGTWSFGDTYDVLIYSPKSSDKLDDYFFVGNTIEVDGVKLNVDAVSYASRFVRLSSTVNPASDLTKVFKTFNSDVLRIISLEITDPGYGYITTPVLDWASVGDGNATGTVTISGSYVLPAVLDKSAEFGYIIRSGIPYSRYINILKRTAHPAGYKVNGEYISVSFDVDVTSLRLYQLFQPERENKLNASNERLFFKMVIEMAAGFQSTMANTYSGQTLTSLSSNPISYYAEKDLRVRVSFTDLTV